MKKSILALVAMLLLTMTLSGCIVAPWGWDDDEGHHHHHYDNGHHYGDRRW